MAGILFAIEELRINVPDSAFAAAMVACADAPMVANGMLLGQQPGVDVHSKRFRRWQSAGVYRFGAILGCFSWLYNRSLIGLTLIAAIYLLESKSGESRRDRRDLGRGCLDLSAAAGWRLGADWHDPIGQKGLSIGSL